MYKSSSFFVMMREVSVDPHQEVRILDTVVLLASVVNNWAGRLWLSDSCQESIGVSHDNSQLFLAQSILSFNLFSVESL